MDTKTRTVAKAATWQLLGLAVMTGLAWMQTGNVAGAFSLAVSAAASGTVFYVLHERLWSAIGWGRVDRRS